MVTKLVLEMEVVWWWIRYWVDMNGWETVTGEGKIVSKFKNQK